VAHAAFDVLTSAYIDLGRPDEAAQAAALAEERATALGLPMAAAWADSAAATVALDAGDVAAGAERVAAGDRRRAGGRGDRYGAVTHARRPGPGQGATTMPRSSSSAPPRRSRRAALLTNACASSRASGGSAVRSTDAAGPRRRAARGVASLTGRELQVAELVVDRRTNPEIARELYLSLKTVEAHLRNIVRKLDVSNRAQLARLVEPQRRGGSG